MLQIDVLNRQQAEDYNPQQARVIDILAPVMISITSPDKPANLKEGWYEVLRLEFHDVLPTYSGLDEDLTAFDTDMAAEVLDFAFKHGNRNMFVHCDAGVSRSVAVGMFIAAWQERTLSLHAVNCTDFYNSHVHGLLSRRLWSVVYKEDR
jgi:predicted protein tyrosine phosphatase